MNQELHVGRTPRPESRTTAGGNTLDWVEIQLYIDQLFSILTSTHSRES